MLTELCWESVFSRLSSCAAPNNVLGRDNASEELWFEKIELLKLLRVVAEGGGEEQLLQRKVHRVHHAGHRQVR